MSRELAVEPELARAARQAFENPQPRLREGRWLAASAHVHAMMDLSDGLSSDVARLAPACGCGAELNDPALHPAAEAVARAAGDEAERYALDGGEDFELLVAVAARAYPHLAKRFAERFGKPLYAVGRLESEPGLRRRERDETTARTLLPAGYDHLAGS
jgi:thiamine-monophosphate kinase